MDHGPSPLKQLFRAFLAWGLRLLYRVEITGMENYQAAGPRAVIAVNHVSFLDAALLEAFLPGDPLFAIDTQIAKAWWLKPFLPLADTFAMDPTKPFAMKELIKLIRGNRHCIIFPEGRITVTGSLMKIYEGPGLITEKADAPLVPIRIDGAQYTIFSRLRGKQRLQWFPKITLTILPPRRFEIPPGLTGKERRRRAGLQLYDIMADMIFETDDRELTLFEALREARDLQGSRKVIVEDMDRQPLTYGRLIQAAHVLGRKLAALTRPREFVGVLLPNSVGGAVTFFALQAIGRVPAMLNFSTGIRNMLSGLESAQIFTVLTSRRFVEVGKLEETVESLGRAAKIHYLEDIREGIGLFDKLGALVARWRAGSAARKLGVSPIDPAVVLFTSGSEGTPKGVVLSHRNIISNRYQLSACLDFRPTDTVLNAMPVFHSFGLTGGLLLPLYSGVRTFLYPSPLHYRIVPALAYDINATIIFGTDTFLNGYWMRAHPYDFYNVRYVFAGAEKVKDETRRHWSDKFGLRLLEGYGATETSPALCANTPMHFKAGSVGRFLPGIRHRLEPVEGIDEGGRLVVAGPNVMLGYLKADAPGKLQPPPDGEYDTGDIVKLDDDGFVTILGRAKRFAKVAGEMVSLGAVENHIGALWPDSHHAVVAVPDPRRGEQLVLVTDHEGATREALLSKGKSEGLSELMVPREVRVVDKVPLLGTGKVDYQAIKKMLDKEASEKPQSAAKA
jgi:acyl-[acyl-carrier-protein]-phospholipid O-acyltransferase/long-chain-fatty-acid--[acyl-carrier-protein] ligase